MEEYRLTPDGVQARRMTDIEIRLLEEADTRLTHIRVPNLLATRYDRLFVAAMDGTGNHLYKDAPQNVTLVGQFKVQIEQRRHPALKVAYMPGVGTQDDSLASAIDSVRAITFQARVEQLYLEFCEQSAAWLRQDPDARIHLVGIGFSRGAEAVAALQRTVHERGIRNPRGVAPKYDEHGLLERITWADLPPLVPPGRTVQAALLRTRSPPACAGMTGGYRRRT